MNSQNNKGTKNNGHVNYSLPPTTISSSGSTPRRSSSRYSKLVITSASESSLTVDALANLIASSCGEPVVATVACGARYQGILSSADISTGGTSSLSVILVNPKLISASLINEKSNVDQSFPERIIIQGKDLIDIQVTKPVKEKEDAKGEDDDIKDGKNSNSTSIESLPKKVPAPLKPISYSELARKADLKPTTSPLGMQTLKKKLPVPMAPANGRVSSKSSAAIESSVKTEPPSKFKTDRDISTGYKFREREFEVWKPDVGSTEISMDDSNFNAGSWDQFKVNEEKFGVESTYDEHLYTTRVDTSAKDYNERLQRAQKIAREIEGLATLDRHVLEERGATIDDSGMDEEDKYSGVLNDSVVTTPQSSVPIKTDTRGSELMAALRIGSNTSETRSGPYNMDQASPISGANKYTTPGQRAAQYHNDPAIVSSSATKKPAPLPKTESPVSIVSKEKKAVPASAISSTNKSVAETSTASSGVPGKGNPAALKETFRLNAQSEINSLKQFSASFKVPHKLPNDLIPILAKDKSKQDEILKKQESSKSIEVSSIEKDQKNGIHVKEQTGESGDVKQPTAKATLTSGTREGNRFKLNPKAAAFTPSRPMQVSPLLANNPAVSSPQVLSHNLGNSNPGREKRFHTLSALEIFGTKDKIPTPESQKIKLQRFRSGFNMFGSVMKEYEAKVIEFGKQETKKTSSTTKPALNKPLFPKMFLTPPTWDSTVDESFEKVITDQYFAQASTSAVPGMSFVGAPMMNVPGSGAHMAVPGGYSAGKYPVSSSMQHSMMQFQQQQMQAAMFYQQFQGNGGGRPTPQMMYMAPGQDPQYMAPGFMVPGMVGHGQMSPSYPGGDGVYSGGSIPSHDVHTNPYSHDRQHGSNHGSNYGNHGTNYNGNRRHYNQKRTHNT